MDGFLGFLYSGLNDLGNGWGISMRKLHILMVLFGLIGVAFAAPQRANAADIPQLDNLPQASDYELPPATELQFEFVPLYVWITGMSGDLGVFGTKAKIDITPIDIVKNLGDFLKVLDGVYFGSGQLRFGDFDFMYDVTYLEVSSTKKIDGALLTGALDVGFGMTVGTLLGTYKVYETETSQIDALAGVRIWDVDLDVQLALGPIEGGGKEGDTWVDPVFGFKGRHYLTEQTYLTGWAMIGGFGAGSDFMYDVFGGVGYEINDMFSAVGGFRASYADYKGKDGFLWDVTMYGPIIGASVKF
jgi:hypothetical protein